jgi:hypothetical protein
MNALGMTHIHLRYYATGNDRVLWQKDFGESLPPHEDPPFDRDRFLPVPPFPLQAHAGWLPGDDDDPVDHDGVSDPLGLAAVDDEIANIQSESTDEFEPMEPGHGALEAQFRVAEPENWTPPAEQSARKKLRSCLPLNLRMKRSSPFYGNCCITSRCRVFTFCIAIT